MIFDGIGLYNEFDGSLLRSLSVSVQFLLPTVCSENLTLFRLLQHRMHSQAYRSLFTLLTSFPVAEAAEKKLHQSTRTTSDETS